MANTIEQLDYYFNQHIRGHSKVLDCRGITTPNKDVRIYEIDRKDGLPKVRVFITAAYEFGEDDYAARPNEIKVGDFILISKFHPGAGSLIVEQARLNRVAVGDWTKMFGALNYHRLWEYRTAEEKEK